ncbi:MAG: RNA methyltransferase [Myxococcota bacterium]
MHLEAISTLDDPRVAAYRNVRDADLRAGQGGFLAEGRLNVKRLIQAPRFRARSVFATRAAVEALTPTLAALDEETPIYCAEAALLKRVVGYNLHRGCLAEGDRGVCSSPDALLSGLSTERPVTVLVLEDLTNPDNVGGVFRNALAFGVDAVLLTQRCADPLYRKAIRVSMGASFAIDFTRGVDAAALHAALETAGFESVALATGPDARPVSRWLGLPSRLALWCGSEGEGLSSAALALARERIEIPMVDRIDSLNVATASGIALHQVRTLREASA